MLYLLSIRRHSSTLRIDVSYLNPSSCSSGLDVSYGVCPLACGGSHLNPTVSPPRVPPDIVFVLTS